MDMDDSFFSNTRRQETEDSYMPVRAKVQKTRENGKKKRKASTSDLIAKSWPNASKGLCTHHAP